MIDDADRLHLQRALELAERGARTAAPNPVVGCVIARHGTAVAEGWHIAPGQPHAEAMALDVAQEGARDATAYVTLEPCAHHGRTPPCADALIAAGIARVVVLAGDPAPHASGAGLQRLADAGVEVVLACDDDPLSIAARRQNAGFRTSLALGRPHVTYKAAQTLDGRTATRTGDSRWISGTASRAYVHELRARAGAQLVHVGARGGAGDPAAVAGARRRPPVEGLRGLVRDVRPAERQRRAEAGVLAPRGDAERVVVAGEHDLHAGVGEPLQPGPRRVRRRIARQHHDARDARSDQGVRARRRAAVVRARLERDVRGRIACALLRDVQRHGLGVRLAGRDVPALGDGGAVARDHAADDGVRRGRARAALRELERALEVQPVGVVDHARSVRATPSARPRRAAARRAPGRRRRGRAACRSPSRR